MFRICVKSFNLSFFDLHIARFSSINSGEDTHPKCTGMKNYCQHKDHGTRVKNLCPKTCEICGEETTTTPQATTTIMSKIIEVGCEDKTPLFCKKEARKCQWPKYKSLMATKCAKTCKACPILEKRSGLSSTSVPEAVQTTTISKNIFPT